MRINARVDVNQPIIVKNLRKLGYSVLVISNLKNCFDILVGKDKKNYCFELKDPNQPPSKRKLTDGEQKFFENWRGQVHLVHSVEEIIGIIENI